MGLGAKIKRGGRIDPFIVAVALFLVAIVGILIFLLIQSFSQEQYGGDMVRIGNLSEYFSGVPRDTEEALYNSLYDIIVANSGEIDWENLSMEGIIRDGSARIVEQDDEKRGVFIVDVPSVRQSYRGSFVLGNLSDDNSGYSVVFTCLDKTELIYEDFNCRDVFSKSDYEVPICNVLPVFVSDFDFASRISRTYSISCYFTGEDSADLIINDYSGGNYERALEKIRELGYDPNDYNIEYNDAG